jgi:hypothetical protein
VRAWAPSRWTYFTRTGRDVLKVREPMMAYVSSHRAVSTKLGDAHIVPPAFSGQLDEAMGLIGEALDTKMQLIQSARFGAAFYVKGLFDRLRRDLGNVP